LIDRQEPESGTVPQPRDLLLDDLPDPAENWAPEPRFSPDDDELRLADRDQQIELMREWFLSRYCDPANETPYESAEGGYIWIWGGPYYAEEELQERFAGVVDDETIEALADDLNSDGIYEWAPIRSDDDSDYEDRFGLEIDPTRPDAPLYKLRDRLAQALSVLSLRGNAQAMEQLPKMVFGAAISALEAYLWETVALWAKGNREVLKAIVTGMPALRDQQIKLGEVFDVHDGIEARVMIYLQNIVWHRFDTVAKLLRQGLGVKPPSFKAFVKALERRHDIVHRSGHDKDGNPVAVTADDAKALAAEVEEFACKLYQAILENIVPDELSHGADEF
jgi:DNA-binding MarR family transcriptional regulator